MSDNFRLAHLTDVHLGPLPPIQWRELFSKRALGYYNWLRARSRRFRQEVLDAMVADVHAQRPDHIVVSGDLCNISLPAEFTGAADWLRTLGEPADVTVVPGNHDAYVNSGRMRSWQAWRPFMSGDVDEATDPKTAFPFLRRRGEIALIGLSTGVATSPTFATGRLGRKQLMRLDRMLETLDPEPARVVVLHHPPMRQLTSFRRRLVDDSGLRKIVARHRIDLVLCGHEHRMMVGHLKGPRRPTPVVVGPAALLGPHDEQHEPGGYLEHTLDRSGGGWRVSWSMRRFSLSRHAFVEAARGDAGQDVDRETYERPPAAALVAASSAVPGRAV